MRHYLTLVFISAWAIPLANAAPATCPSSGTYAMLMGLNTAGGCTIENLMFFEFHVASTATGGATPVAPSDLAISGVVNSAPSAVGFDFAGIPMVALLRQTIQPLSECQEILQHACVGQCTTLGFGRSSFGFPHGLAACSPKP